MRALVTGGAGFIGSNLVRALVERGDRVRVLDDLSTGREPNLAAVRDEIELTVGDVRDPEAVLAACTGAEVVFHEAAIPSVARSVADPLASNEVNVTGTLQVLLAAREAGVGRVVFASSAAVYGDAERLPLHEGLPARPVSPYGVSKLAGERYLEAFTRTYGLSSVALRYLNVYGPGQDPRSGYAAAIPRFLSAALAREPATVFGDGSAARDFVFVGDVVSANLLAADAGNEVDGLTCNVGTGRRTTIRELLTTVAELHPPQPEPVSADPRPGEIRDSWSDPSLAAETLGFRAEVDLREGLARTLDALAPRT
jgi:UDP-glucose 4-epimerase